MIFSRLLHVARHTTPALFGILERAPREAARKYLQVLKAAGTRVPTTSEDLNAASLGGIYFLPRRGSPTIIQTFSVRIRALKEHSRYSCSPPPAIIAGHRSSVSVLPCLVVAILFHVTDGMVNAINAQRGITVTLLKQDPSLFFEHI